MASDSAHLPRPPSFHIPSLLLTAVCLVLLVLAHEVKPWVRQALRLSDSNPSATPSSTTSSSPEEASRSSVLKATSGGSVSNIASGSAASKGGSRSSVSTVGSGSSGTGAGTGSTAVMGAVSVSRIARGSAAPVWSAFRQSAILPSRSDISFQHFLKEAKAAFEVRRLSQRPLHLLFSGVLDIPHPHCNGFWLEFGVFTGRSINLTARWRRKHCGSLGGIYGFDTFTGLPEQWSKDAQQGHFSLQGALPPVEPGVVLQKGLFNETLPKWLEGVRKRELALRPVTYVHIDCDLYQGAIEALTLLNDLIEPGCVLLFDELFNYPGYDEHELKALWEWVTNFDRQVEAVGKLGSADLMQEAVVLQPTKDLGRNFQSALFVVHK